MANSNVVGQTFQSFTFQSDLKHVQRTRAYQGPKPQFDHENNANPHMYAMRMQTRDSADLKGRRRFRGIATQKKTRSVKGASYLNHIKKKTVRMQRLRDGNLDLIMENSDPKPENCVARGYVVRLHMFLFCFGSGTLN